MSKITDAFTVVDVQCSFFTRINFLFVNHIFSDPSSLNYIADFVGHYANTESDLYRVGIVYRDNNLNGNRDFVLFDQYTYPLYRIINHVYPLGVGIFLAKDFSVIDKNMCELGDIYPSVNFIVSGMDKTKVFIINRPFFGSSNIPYENADPMTQSMYKTAYDTARGLLITLKVHDRPSE